MDLKKIESLTIDDIKPIAVSFKKEEDELDLYKWILKKSGMVGISGFIKDKLREIKENESPKMENKSCEANKTELIDMDF
jgi:acetate kinase